MDDMPSGLFRRNATYYTRRRIPKAALDAFSGKKEIVRALGTSDREEAKRLHALMWLQLEAEFEDARSRHSADPNAHLIAKLKQIEIARASKPSSPQTITDDELEYVLAKHQEDCQAELRQEVEYERRDLSRQRILAVLQVENLDTLSEADKALRDILIDHRDDLAAAQRRAIDVSAARPPEPVSTRRVELGVTATPRTADRALSAVVKRWAVERAPKPKTVRAHAAVIQWFIDRTGVLDADGVTREHVQTFKALLIDERQSPANIRTKLSRLRTILSYAVSVGLIPSNPATGVQAPKSKGGKARLPWPVSDLNKLFAGPVHRLGERPVRGRGEAAYWLPLMALFTGARREELAQLRNEDIRSIPYFDGSGEETAGWIFDFDYGENDDKDLKTSASQRQTPVHQTLIDLGILDLVRFNSPKELLFPELKPDGDGKLGEKWGQWFSLYKRETGVTARRIVFHSMRHNFKDMCREARVPKHAQIQLMGHSEGEVSEDYGIGYPMHELFAYMNSCRVPGLHLPKRPM